MSASRQTTMGIVMAWLVFTMLPACALAPPSEIPSQTGRVLDESTQQPIEGAIVVLRWQGMGTKAFVDTQTVCYHVESAESDTNGRYATTPWTEESRHRDLSMKQMIPIVYKAGYRYVRVDKVTGNQYLQRDTGTEKGRLEYLQRLLGMLLCGSDEDVYKLENVVDAIYAEANDLCVRECDRKLLSSIHYQRDVFKYGWEAAQERKRRGEYK